MLLSAPMATNSHRLKPAGSTSASSPNKATLAILRPSTATGASNSHPRRAAHSPTPSNGSGITTSPSTTSLQSLTHSTPSAYTFSGLKSRLSTKQKSKGKRSFTSSGAQLKANASISPPATTLAPVPSAANGRPNLPTLKTQKSVDSAMFMTAAAAVGSGRNFSNGTLDTTMNRGVIGLANVSPAIPSMYDTVHEIAEKRINTLDYLRRAHEGRVYWYNTVQFTKDDLPRRVQPDLRRLARRAANFFVLGQSLPSVLELGTPNPMDYLKALNTLLAEFDAYQSTHPADGSLSSTASKGMGRVKLWARTTTTKPRRGSSAAQGGIDGLYHFTAMDNLERLKGGSGMFTHHNPLPTPLAPHSSNSNNDDITSEDYTYLVHSSLPFEPDYYETFATLCDVLIDAYSRVLTLINAPTMCGFGVGECFIKADTKIRKTVLSTVVKEFEEASRVGAKSEIVGLARNVLGSLV